MAASFALSAACKAATGCSGAAVADSPAAAARPPLALQARDEAAVRGSKCCLESSACDATVTCWQQPVHLQRQASVQGTHNLNATVAAVQPVAPRREAPEVVAAEAVIASAEALLTRLAAHSPRPRGRPPRRRETMGLAVLQALAAL